ncbi:MAG TPA: NADH-quinone oxidoreductase subunit J [Thermodesulfobacteriaceae bacterium]|nr:NADH-quinone oxidoreductase subunit J [Thermodesulfobacteriaceae bacterium]
MAVNVRNPVHSVLLVLAMFFHMAGVYLMLNAEFLAAVQVIVYAGAVLVLYLFVVFLVNIKEEIRLKRFIGSYTTGRVITIGMLATLLAAAWSFKLGPAGTWSIEAVREITHTRALGIEMFSHYMLPFEIAGVILLVAVVGGMALAKKDRNRATTTEERRALMRGEELGE